MSSLLKRYLAVSLVLGVPLLAMQVDGPGVPGASAKLDVRVINVDAHVSDSDGKPYLGLGAADFEVLEDGKPQEVTHFRIVEKAGVRSSPDGQAQPDARFHRRVAIVVDNNNIEKRDRDEALLTFEKFADESIGQDAEWSVGIIGERFELLQPFTSDKATLKGALKKVRNTPARVGMTDLRRDLLSDSLRRNQARDGYDYEGGVGFANREQTQRGAQSALSTVKGIVEATRAYGQSTGKKVMFLISGGMQLNTTFTAYEKKGGDGEVNDARREIQKLLEGVVQEANAVDVSIDVIAARTRGSLGPQFDVENGSAGFNRPTLPKVHRDPQNSRPPGSAMSQVKMNDPIDVGDNDSSNFKIATGTGGLYLTSNRVRDSFDLAETSSSHYYSLGYRPTHPEDGQYHAITVRLKQPGYRLTHRKGYLDLTPEQQLQELLQLRVSTLQLSNAVPVSLQVSPATTPDGKPAVGFTASMPMKNITFLGGESGAAYNGRVHVYLSIFDRSGKNVGFHHLTKDIVVPANLREKALADSFHYKMSMKLDRGEYTLAVTLRDDLSRDIGTAIQKVKL
ncbi:MAG: VWA domain-containing protein [Acidobacteriota bacterium]